jgi:ribose transport system substrate-binding protein
MNTLRKLRYLTFGTAIALAVAAPAAQSAETSKPVRIAFLAGQVGIPFYTTVQCGAEKAAKEFNVDLSWTGPPDWDISLQQPFIDAALQTHPDGIVLSPTDGKALITQVKALEDAGTPVVTIDAPLDEPVDSQNIQSNHYQGGIAAANAMVQIVGDSGTFLVVGMRPGLPDIDARVKGFIDTFKKEHPAAKLLPVAYPETSSTKAAQQVASAIQANPDLRGVYVTHSAAAAGASAAILEAGKQREIKLVSFDADPEQIRDLKQGIYDALIVQEPYAMGYNAVKSAAELARKQTTKATIKHDAFLPFVVVTRSNVGDKDVSQYFYVSKCP